MRRLVLVLALLVGISSPARAQLKGHYIPGFMGLESGTQPPPSITLAVPIYFYPTDTIKDPSGETIGAHPSIRASFTGISVLWVTKVKILDANWGFQAVPADWMKSRIEGRSLDVPGSIGFSDLTFAPVWLGWHTARADVTAGWSFFVPTGKWELGGDENAGLGMWSNDFQAGTTVHLDNKHAWSTSLLATYEIHSHKKDTQIKAGDILTLEGGTGRTFMKPVAGSQIPMITNVGLVYYGQFKVTSDTGSSPLITNLLAGDKDRVFGVGGEVNVFLPKAKLLLGGRIIPEFGARNRTRGTTVMITAGYQLK